MKTRRRLARDTQLRKLGIAGGSDRRAAEMLGLELTMLAKAYGLNVARMEITTPKRNARARRPRVKGRSTGGDVVRNATRRGRGGA